MDVNGTCGDLGTLKVAILKELSRDEKITLNLSKVPEDGTRPVTLKLPNGCTLYSPNEICRYIIKRLNIPSTPEEDALVDYWFEWEAVVLLPAVKDSLMTNEPSEAMLAALGHLEVHLKSHQSRLVVSSNVCLDEVSLADVIVWTSLFIVLSPECDFSSRLNHDYSEVAMWFRKLARSSLFTQAVWLASNDEGYDAFLNSLVTQTKPKKEKSNSGKKPTEKAEQVKVKTNDSGGGGGVGQASPVGDQSPVDKVTQSEIDAAAVSWREGPKAESKPCPLAHPILPKPGERNILVTSALPYVNNVPHLGNIIGCVLSADVFVRYARLRNYNVLYVCGTDEYGTATETKALKEGLTPQQICDKYFDIHSEIYKWFNIEFDIFGRTSTPHQTQISQDIFWHLYNNGYISEGKVDQLFCTACQRYLADRFVEGTCPLCAYPDARGDQCDKCGRLINAIELKSPRCSICSSSPIVSTSDHLFLDLTKLEPTVLDWFHNSSKQGYWSQNAQLITAGWLRDGLKPRCITRDLKWGTPVPLDGYTDKVFYVWFDAPIGYISITACYTDQWELWWKNPNEVQLYQFMAKDNVPFHTVVFPSTLLGTSVDYTLLNHISSTEYLNYEDGKFSKSRSVGVFGNDAQDTGIPADIYRFYLLYVRPETQDSTFSWSDFITKNNSELLNNLGNFINRTLTFLKNNFESTVPPMTLSDDDKMLLALINREIEGYIDCLEKLKIRDGLKYILNISRHGNGHIQAHKPWDMMKGDPNQRALAGSVIGVCVNVCCLLSVLLQPYMPAVSQEIQSQLKAPGDCNVILEQFVPYLNEGHVIGEPYPLFKKFDESTAETFKKQFGGQQAHGAGGGAAANVESKATLESELEKQSNLVRELKKTGTASKERLDQEIAKLLEIKSKLGISTAGGNSKKKSKKGNK